MANAGAALLGLEFVGVSMHLSRRPVPGEAGRLRSASVIILHPLLGSLGMLLPVDPTVQGIGLLVLAAAGLIGAGEAMLATLVTAMVALWAMSTVQHWLAERTPQGAETPRAPLARGAARPPLELSTRR